MLTKWEQSPVSTFQQYFQRVVKGVRNPSQLLPQGVDATNPTSILQRMRNIDSAQAAAGAVIVAELLGFFTVGEMIGRMKIVGYRGDTGAHH
jgi:F-type H+-transporting ATPase subunit g